MQQLRLFLIALQFFTRIPIPRWVGFEPPWLQQSSRYFPAVGWLVGAWSAAVFWVAARYWPQPVAALLATAAGVWLTGAFHEDGFADVCDGFGGGMQKERVLEIMKDSRIGAYGAIGIALMLILKCTLLAGMPAALAVPALLLAHAWSRLFALALIWRLRYVREEGKAKPLAERNSNGEFALATLTVAAPTAALLWLQPALAARLFPGLAIAALASLMLSRMFVRRIGGYTGDCLGAVQQVAEVGTYLGFAALI